MASTEQMPLMESKSGKSSYDTTSVVNRETNDGLDEPLISDEPAVAARMRFTVFNLGNTVLGGGILSLPYAMKLTGWFTGLVLLIVMCLLSIYSLHLLTLSAEYLNVGAKTSYRVGGTWGWLDAMAVVVDVASAAFGRPGQVAADVCMVVACFGVMCSYVILVTDMLLPLFIDIWPSSRDELRLLLLCCSMVFLVPLAGVRYLNNLRYFKTGPVALHPPCTPLFFLPLRLHSALAILAVIFVVLVVVIRSGQALAEGTLDNCETKPEGCPLAFNWNKEIFKAIPIIGFAYTCQMSFFAAYNELASPSPRRIKKVIWRALLSCFVLYSICAVFGYLEFRALTDAVILNNYTDTSDILIQFVRVAVALEIGLGFPMSAFPCISTIDSLLFGKRPFSWYRKIPETLVTCALALIVAILVKDVSFIIALTGALASTPICFILPAAFIFKLSPAQGWRSLEKVGTVSLMAVGVFIMFISTAVTIIDFISPPT